MTKKNSWVLGWIFFWFLAIGAPLGSFLFYCPIFTGDFSDAFLFVLKGTFYQAGVSTIFSAVFGLILGEWIGSLKLQVSHRFFHVLLLLLIVPFFVPQLLASWSWIQCLSVFSLGREKILYSFSAVILAHVFFNIPWIAFWVAQARSECAFSQIQVARSFGASFWKQWCFVIWPQVRLPFGMAVLSTFSFCFTSFLLVLLLGGGPPVQTLEIWIYEHFRNLHWHQALFATGILLGIQWFGWGVVFFQTWKKKNQTWGKAMRGSQIEMWVQGASFLKKCIALSMCGFFLFPYLWGISWKGWGILKNGFFWEAVQNSFFLALSVSVVVLSFTFWTLWVFFRFRKHRLFAFGIAGSVLLPSGVSPIAFSLLFWICWHHLWDPFTEAFFSIVCIQSVLFFPLIFRHFFPLVLTQSEKYFLICESFGGSFWHKWKYVLWPRWKKPAAVAFFICFFMSFTEGAVVWFFHDGERVFLPSLWIQWISQYRFDQAAFLGNFYVFLSVFFLLFWAFLGSKEGLGEGRAKWF